MQRRLDVREEAAAQRELSRRGSTASSRERGRCDASEVARRQRVGDKTSEFCESHLALEPPHALAVQPAVFEQRGDMQRKRLGKEDAAKLKRQKKVQQRQLMEWDDELAGGAGNKTVVLLGLFTEEEASEDAENFYANLKQDVEVECRKAGALEKVHIFEGSERGAAAVKFKSPEDAQRCVAMMNERSGR